MATQASEGSEPPDKKARLGKLACPELKYVHKGKEVLKISMSQSVERRDLSSCSVHYVDGTVDKEDDADLVFENMDRWCEKLGWVRHDMSYHEWVPPKEPKSDKAKLSLPEDPAPETKKDLPEDPAPKTSDKGKPSLPEDPAPKTKKDIPGDPDPKTKKDIPKPKTSPVKQPAKPKHDAEIESYLKQ